MIRNYIIYIFITCVAGLPANPKETSSLHYTIRTTFNGSPLDKKDEVHIKLSQIPESGDVQLDIEAPFYGDSTPDGTPGLPYLGLWNYEVVEVFFLNDNDQYLEVEVGPYGHHIVLLLNGQRRTVRHSLPLEVETKISEGRWSGNAIIPQDYFPPQVTRFNAYAIHGAEPNRHYLSLYPAFKNSTKPDFHDLRFFQPMEMARVQASYDIDDSSLSSLWESAVEGIFRYEITHQLPKADISSSQAPVTTATLQGFEGGVEVNYTMPVLEHLLPEGFTFIFDNKMDSIKVHLPISKVPSVELSSGEVQKLNRETLGLDYYVDASSSNSIKGSALIPPPYFPPNITMMTIKVMFSNLKDNGSVSKSELTTYTLTTPLDFNLLVRSNVEYSDLWSELLALSDHSEVITTTVSKGVSDISDTEDHTEVTVDKDESLHLDSLDSKSVKSTEESQIITTQSSLNNVYSTEAVAIRDEEVEKTQDLQEHNTNEKEELIIAKSEPLEADPSTTPMTLTDENISDIKNTDKTFSITKVVASVRAEVQGDPEFHMELKEGAASNIAEKFSEESSPTEAVIEVSNKSESEIKVSETKLHQTETFPEYQPSDIELAELSNEQFGTEIPADFRDNNIEKTTLGSILDILGEERTIEISEENNIKTTETPFYEIKSIDIMNNDNNNDLTFNADAGKLPEITTVLSPEQFMLKAESKNIDENNVITENINPGFTVEKQEEILLEVKEEVAVLANKLKDLPSTEQTVVKPAEDINEPQLESFNNIAVIEDNEILNTTPVIPSSEVTSNNHLEADFLSVESSHFLEDEINERLIPENETYEGNESEISDPQLLGKSGVENEVPSLLSDTQVSDFAVTEPLQLNYDTIEATTFKPIVPFLTSSVTKVPSTSEHPLSDSLKDLLDEPLLVERDNYQRRIEGSESSKNDLLDSFEEVLNEIEERKETIINSFNDIISNEKKEVGVDEKVNEKENEIAPFGLSGVFPPPHPVCFTEGLVPDHVRCQVFYECVLHDGKWEVYNWRCKRGFYYDHSSIACIRGYC